MARGLLTMSLAIPTEPHPLYVGGKYVPRKLPMVGQNLCHPLHWHSQSFEKKHLERESLINLIEEWVAKLAKHNMVLWYVDRKCDATRAVKSLMKTPDLAVPELQSTPYGCRYLIDQWEYLREQTSSIYFVGAFCLEDHILTLSLAGVPFHQRTRYHHYNPPPNLTKEQAGAHVRNFIDSQLVELRTYAEAHAQEEATEQRLAETHATHFPDKKLKSLKRDLQKLERELFAMNRFVMESLDEESKSELESEVLAQAASDAVAEAENRQNEPAYIPPPPSLEELPKPRIARLAPTWTEDEADCQDHHAASNSELPNDPFSAPLKC